MYNYPTTELYRFKRALLFLQNNESLNDCENFTYLTANLLKYLASILPFYPLHILYLVMSKISAYYAVYKFLRVSQFSCVQCSFSRILIKKTLGKSKSNLRAQRDFVFLFLSFFFCFLLSWVESIKARTPDGVAETQFLQNFGPFPRKTFNRYFFKSIELQGYTFRLELFQYDL